MWSKGKEELNTSSEIDNIKKDTIQNREKELQRYQSSWYENTEAK